MKKTTALLASLAFAGVIFTISSCTKTGPQGDTGPAGATGATGATGPAGPVLYSTITGNVIMNTEYGDNITTLYGTGYILIKNSTTNVRVDSIIPNSTSGAYSIDSIPTGTYNMYCIYPGYGEGVTQSIRLTGGSVQLDNKIAQIPTFVISTANDTIGTYKADTNYVYLYGTISPAPTGEATVLIFAGSTSSTSSTPPNYSFVYPATVLEGQTNFNVRIPITTVYNNGFAYGSNIFFTVYAAANNYGYGAYVNYTYGQDVFTAIAPIGVNALPFGIVLPLY